MKSDGLLSVLRSKALSLLLFFEIIKVLKRAG